MKRIRFLVIVATILGATLTSCHKNLEEFLVLFETNYAGFTVKSQLVLEGEKIAKPDDPSRSEYRLAAWYKEEESINEWRFDFDIVTSNIKLFAKWEYVLENFNFNSEQAKSLLLGKAVTHDTWTDRYTVIITEEDLLRCTTDIIIAPLLLGEGIKNEHRVAWQIHLEAPVYYIFQIDVMTGEIITSSPTIIF